MSSQTINEKQEKIIDQPVTLDQSISTSSSTSSSTSLHETFLKVKKSIESVEKLPYLGTVFDPTWRYDDDHDEEEKEEDEDEDEDDRDEEGEVLKKTIANQWSSFTDGMPFYITNECPAFDFIHVDGKKLPSKKAELLAMATQSPFGDLKTCSTVINLDVRNAYEIKDDPSKGMKVELTKKAQRYLDQSKDEISSRLFADKPISFKLNKINIYTKGGMFKRHVDTPRSNVLGTLLVLLPHKYEGGEFKIKCSGSADTNEDKWISDHGHSGYEYVSYSSSRRLRMSAFYCESDHMIETVTSGCRLSVSFYVIDESLSDADNLVTSDVEEEKEENEEENEEEDEKENDEKLETSPKKRKLLSTTSAKQTKKSKKNSDADDFKEIIKRANNWKDAGVARHNWQGQRCELIQDLVGTIEKYLQLSSQPIGLMLSNKYSNNQFLTNSLRGADALLMKALSASRVIKQPPLQLPVLIYHSETSPATQEYGEKGTHSMEVFRFTEQDIDSVNSVNSVGGGTEKKKEKKLMTDISFIGCNQWEIMAINEIPSCEFSGNESCDASIDNHYFSNAIILRLSKNDTESIVEEKVKNLEEKLEKELNTEVKIETKTEEILFVECGCEDDGGNLCKIFLQFSSNQNALKVISDFIKEEKLDDCWLNLDTFLTEREAELVVKYGNNEDKGVEMKVIKGKMTLPDDDSWRNKENVFFYENVCPLFSNV